MTSNKVALVLAAMTDRRLDSIVARLPAEARSGRPWSRPLRQRVLITCAVLAASDPLHDRRESSVVDLRDHWMNCGTALSRAR